MNNEGVIVNDISYSPDGKYIADDTDDEQNKINNNTKKMMNSYHYNDNYKYK